MGKIDDKEERRRNMGKESKKITRRAFLKAGLVAGGAATTGFPTLLRPAHAQVKEIKIGLLAPLTGLAAVWGQRTFNAYELAAELINQAGGIKSMGGVKIKVVVADTENKPEVAAIQAERLISDRDLIVLSGSNQSSATMVASQITERNRLCFITGSDPLDEITGRGFQFTYRATLLMGDYVRDLIYYARDMGKKTGKVVKKMANLSENSVAGIASGKAVSKYAKEVGFEVVDSSTYDPGSTRDFTGYISKYKSAGIDFVVSFSRPQDAIIITRTMKELNFNPLAFGGIASGLTTSEYGKILGKDSNFIIAAANFTENAENIPKLKDLITLWRKRYNIYADASFLAGFSVVPLVHATLEKNPTYDREKFKEALDTMTLKVGEYNNLQFEGIKWTPNHDNAIGKAFIIQWENGEAYAVSPGAHASRKPVWPKPTWDEIKKM